MRRSYDPAEGHPTGPQTSRRTACDPAFPISGTVERVTPRLVLPGLASMPAERSPRAGAPRSKEVVRAAHDLGMHAGRCDQVIGTEVGRNAFPARPTGAKENP